MRVRCVSINENLTLWSNQLFLEKDRRTFLIIEFITAERTKVKLRASQEKRKLKLDII